MHVFYASAMKQPYQRAVPTLKLYESFHYTSYPINIHKRYKRKLVIFQLPSALSGIRPQSFSLIKFLIFFVKKPALKTFLIFSQKMLF